MGVLTVPVNEEGWIGGEVGVAGAGWVSAAGAGGGGNLVQLV